jgi:lincosamide nucleotidyltransferase A/C/D/E
MSADDVLAVLERLEHAGVDFWVEGGWGIDALLGEETRPHDDLDIVLPRDHWDAAVAALVDVGLSADGDRSQQPASLVLRDDALTVDLHPIVFDARGNGWQPHGPRSWALYPADGFAGLGRIAGRTVRCLSPEVQVRHHLGYAWDDDDLHDLRLLADRFDVALPPEVEAEWR